MDTCLLCLKATSAFDSYIPVNSEIWWKSDVLGIIQKHFWPVDDLPNAVGICLLCWSKLSEFHTFYQNIEEAHRRITDISKQKKFTNCCTEPEILQTSVGKSTLVSNGETTYAVEEIGGDIKIENSVGDYGDIFFEPSIKASNQIAPTPLITEKRKRGRPRKQDKLRNLKGKRGRPRKNSEKVIHNTTLSTNDTIPQYNPTKELVSSAQCATNCSAPKKKGRGRPRKIQNNDENSNRTKEINELPLTGRVEGCSQGEKLVSDKISNINEALKIVNKKQKILSLMKKRKPVQQHKALMRNYIATSVHCMKFFKK